MVAFESAEHPADLVNYGERAWCRLETYMFMCVGEILMRPIHYFGFGMMPGEKGVCFLEEYLSTNAHLSPARQPASPPAHQPAHTRSTTHPSLSLERVVRSWRTLFMKRRTPSQWALKRISSDVR